MPETEPPPPPAPAPPPRALTTRAVVIGLAAALAFAVATPLNDWLLGNTHLYSDYLPPGVTLVVLIVALALNPALGRRRLVAGELAVVVGMLLVLGGVASSGLMGILPQILCLPAKMLPTVPAFAPLGPRPADGDPSLPADTVLPARMFVGLPAHGPIQTNDPEYRLVIDGFFDGLRRGDPTVVHRARVTWRDEGGEVHTAQALGGEVARQQPAGTFLDLGGATGQALAGKRAGEMAHGPRGDLLVMSVAAPGIPWHAWVWPCLNWLPLLGGAFVCCLAVAALVRRQWIEHERLTYPITTVFVNFLQDPAPGRRLAPVLRQRGFWIGFGVVVVVLSSQGLKAWNCLPVAIPTDFDFTASFAGEGWRSYYLWWAMYHPQLHFSVVALIFFLPLDLSFSLWFFFVLGNLVCYVLFQQGVPVDFQNFSMAGHGGFAVECLLIIWIGRRAYGQVLKAAFGGRADPESRAAAPYVWCLLAGMAAMAVTLVAAGAQVHHAVVVVLVFLGISLVLARLVAEAGIPFIQSPFLFDMSQVVYSLTGFHAPLAALAPLMLVGATMLSDTRESLLPFAVQAEYLGHRAQAPRLRYSALLLVVLVMGTVVCGAIMVAVYYRCEHVPNGWPYASFGWQNLQPMLDGWSAGDHNPRLATTWICYGIGGAVVAVTGACRLLFASWPFHPLGFIISNAFPTMIIWFSFFLGWLVKALALRYGGAAVYERLKPVALGLIAGEASAVGLFLIAQVLLHLVGIEVPNVSFLVHW